MTGIKYFIAGMPTLLPIDTGITEVAGSNDSTVSYLFLIGFAVVAIVIGSAIVKSLWNSLEKDFTFLPELTTSKAIGISILWGLALFVVLFLIDGARHTLAPDSWVRKGWTYQLSDSAQGELIKYREQRVAHLHKLDAELLRYASKHDGQFPASLEELDSPDAVVPGTTQLQYVYRSDKDHEYRLLEPEIDEVRYALTPEGEVIQWEKR